MNKAEFSYLIKNPDTLGSEQIDTLKNIVADYPYFSTAHILLAKALLNTKHYEYEKQLKATALSVGDRSILHQFLNTNDLENINENPDFNIPIELKVEKVSKPDFEIGKEEQNALLKEAQELISIAPIQEEIVDLENIEEEQTTIEEVNQIDESISEESNFIEQEIDELETNNHQLPETAEEVQEKEVLLEIPTLNLVNESAQNEFDIEENTVVIDEDLNLPPIEEETLLLNHPITENNLAVNSENEQEFLSEYIAESTIENNPKQESSETIENNTNYQLAETEGTLVRFNIKDNFLPDFDESSLFIEELNIETITKSVLPIVNTPTETPNQASIKKTEILESNDLKDVVFENNELEIDEIIPSFEAVNENNIEEEALVDEQKIITEATEVSENITLEQLLTDENENVNIAEEVLEIETIENHSEAETEEVVTAITEVEEDPIAEIQPDEVTLVEIEEALDIDSEKLTSSIDNFEPQPLEIEVEAPIESHNFIEWLAANNKSEVHLTEFEVKSSLNESNNENEKDDFVEKINQLLKTRANFELARNITNEINSAHVGLPPFERKTIIENSSPIIEESVSTEVNEVNEKQNSTDDEVFEEIEAFTANNPINNTPITESKLTESAIKIETTEEKIENIPFNEIYNGNVESILPDFDALLKNDISTDEDEITEENITTEKIENSAFEEVISDNLIEDTDLKETDFNSNFELAYKPSVIKKIPIITEVEKPIAVAKNNPNEHSKLDVESILDKFMRENPSITRPKSEFFNPATVAKQSVEEKDEIVSETLATIYLKQGLIKKAILTYEKLSLIYPHKITYFATLIKQLKTEHNIN
ncbi:MAG: hypothetical protein ACEQSR_11415 [Candidatus Methylacidiphilales bacterium]